VKGAAYTLFRSLWLLLLLLLLLLLCDAHPVLAPPEHKGLWVRFFTCVSALHLVRTLLLLQKEKYAL
jgi:hypothetical protein